MPLFSGALAEIEKNLRSLEKGERPKAICIGALSDSQLAALNAKRKSENTPDVTAEILFMGRHVYESRVVRDGYSIEDVLDQISSALCAEAIVLDFEYKNMLENPNPRNDNYGNQVRDRAVFETMAKHPRVELFSVIPYGDKKKPPQKVKEVTPKK